MITDHMYDCGPINTGAPCIADDGKPWPQVCGKREHEHKYSEYVDDKENSVRFSDVGSMHEPKPYTGELDWHDHLPPHVD